MYSGVGLRSSFLIGFLLLLGSAVVFGQKTVVRGVIYEYESNELLPFVNIYFPKTVQGTTSDLDGNFVIETKDLELNALAFSYLGYKTERIEIVPGTDQTISVYLRPSFSTLDEIVIRDTRKMKKDTAAIRIYKNVVDNKERNRPTYLDSYTYEEYEKTEYDIYNIKDKMKNRKMFKSFDFYFEQTDTTDEGVAYLPVMLFETISDQYYTKNPKKKKTKVKAEKSSLVVKLDAGLLASLSFDEEFDVYENMVRVNGFSFISPFASGARSMYKYFLADSAYVDDLWCYKLEFTGRRKQDWAFSGHAWIHKGSYAIKSIEMYVLPNVNLNFITNFGLKQTYVPMNDVWFMKDEYVFSNVNLTKNEEKQSFLIKKNSSRENIRINEPIDPKIFNGDQVEVNVDAKDMEDEYWKEKRHVELSENEEVIIHAIDSLQSTKAYKKISWWTYLGSTAYMRTGPVEFGRIYQMYSWNKIEGQRFKVEARTNWRLSKKFQLDGYLAYGTRDKDWKYNLGFRSFLKRENNRWHMVGGHHRFDYIQLDQRDPLLTHDNLLLSLLRNEPLFELLKVRWTNAYYEREWLKGFMTKLSFNHRTFYSVPQGFQFTKDVMREGQTVLDTIPQFHTSEIGAFITFNPKQKIHESPSAYRQYPISWSVPAFYLDIGAGVKGLFKSEYNYLRLEATVRHWWDNRLGSTEYHAVAGKIFGSVPYPLLKMHKGNQSIIARYWAFELMSEFEYASDTYASLWLKHHFNGLIMNQIPLVKKLKLRTIFQSKVAYGTLNEKNLEESKLPLQTTGLNGAYVEMGIGIENIFKLFRVVYLWRLTPRENLTGRDDIMLQGIRLSIHPSL